MLAEIHHQGQRWKVNLSRPLDISIPFRAGDHQVNAWFVPPVSITPVINNRFTGDVKKGGAVNFRNISFNPHGNGTHTECVGHISPQDNSLNDCLKHFFFLAELVSIEPISRHGDSIITHQQLADKLVGKTPEALVLRTLPNDDSKMSRNYSGTNPAYLEAEAAALLAEKNIQHLLVDLPSIDREVDGGKVLAHHSFWRYPYQPRTGCTITELIYVRNEIADGVYLLNLLVAPFENDAAPSKPLLYKVES